MAAVPESPDPSHCPLCGSANGCAMEAQQRTGEAQLPCWCTRADFPRELLDRVPPSSRHRACICAACAAPAGR